jgi:hypothetical protein
LEDLFSQNVWDKVQADGPEELKPPSRGTWFFNWKAADNMYQWCMAAENAKLLSEKELPSRGELDLSQLHVSPLGSQVERQAKRKRQISCVQETDTPARVVPRSIA